MWRVCFAPTLGGHSVQQSRGQDTTQERLNGILRVVQRMEGRGLDDSSGWCVCDVEEAGVWATLGVAGRAPVPPWMYGMTRARRRPLPLQV